MIPVNEPMFGERELEYVLECVRSGWVSSAGKYIQEFEERWAAYCGRRYGVAVSNGTVALELAIKALNLDPGAEVILPSFTIISCALAVIRNGGVPVLVDADPRTWCMDVSQIEDKITKRTRAIMPVHLYGHPVDMDPVLDAAARHGLAVIEDAAEAHGAEYLVDRGALTQVWKRCGSFGDMSCFSFYANKLITSGEGGMIVTDDQKTADDLRSMRNLCFGAENRYSHEMLGTNYRLTNIQAALAVAQLERADEIVSRKKWMGREYTRRLRDIPHLVLPPESPWARNIYWMYGVVLDQRLGIDADQVRMKLLKAGIDTRPFFTGMHEQPVFKSMGLFQGMCFPVSENLARNGFYLPSGTGLKEEQMDAVDVALRWIMAEVNG